MTDHDVIIVGAGSAGCVLADKLSADGRHTVLVLEAGGHDRRLWINMPIGYGKTFYDERVNWKFEAQPDPGLQGRRIYFPRGKVVGGSSSINAMVYCRGLPGDFDDWAQAGNRGWGWQDVQKEWLPHSHNMQASIWYPCSIMYALLSVLYIRAAVLPHLLVSPSCC